jgi:hypothetical protein
MRTFPYTVFTWSTIILGSFFVGTLYCNSLTVAKCLCPGKNKWPVKYEQQEFCGKELNLWHSSKCDPNMSFACTRDQAEATEDYNCTEARHQFCGPVIPEGCDDSKRRSLYDVCMRGRACMQERFAERAMNLTYGKNPQKSKKYP